MRPASYTRTSPCPTHTRAPAADFTRAELRIRYSVSCLALFILLLVGCSPRSDRLPTAPVSGLVTLDGRPLEMGSVTFVPQDGSGRPATGNIQSDGSYRLGTYDDDDGALLGLHKVSVVCQEPRGLPPNDGGGRSLIPLKYTNPGTSELEFNVTDSRNEFNIELIGAE